jgi:outer membrane immunogenic protein
LTLGGVPQAFALNSSHHDGYTVGAGLEYMFAQNWSAKAEYQYYNFGRTQFVTPVDLAPFGSFRNDEHTVKVGLNYRFNFGNFGGPVVGRY